MGQRTSVEHARRTVVDKSTLAASIGGGIFAAAFGLLTATILIREEVADTVGGNVADWKGITWYYVNAHMVYLDLEVSGSVEFLELSIMLDLISQSGSTNAQLLYLVPPLVLVAVGAGLARYVRVRDIGEGVMVGAPITLGYGTVVTLLAIASESSSEVEILGVGVRGSIAPELMPTVVVAGVLYPLVFATAGAVLYPLISTARSVLAKL